MFSKPNWRFQLACVVLSNIFRTITSPLEFKINTGAFKLSAWFSRNIFHITIIQQNIGILSRECRCYLLRRLCIKCFNNSNSRFCVRGDESLTVELCLNKVFLELTFPGLFLSAVHLRFETFLPCIAFFWRDGGGKLSFASIFHSLAM